MYHLIKEVIRTPWSDKCPMKGYQFSAFGTHVMIVSMVILHSLWPSCRNTINVSLAIAVPKFQNENAKKKLTTTLIVALHWDAAQVLVWSTFQLPFWKNRLRWLMDDLLTHHCCGCLFPVNILTRQLQLLDNMLQANSITDFKFRCKHRFLYIFNESVTLIWHLSRRSTFLSKSIKSAANILLFLVSRS